VSYQDRLSSIRLRVAEGHKGNKEVEQYYTADVQWLLNDRASAIQAAVLEEARWWRVPRLEEDRDERLAIGEREAQGKRV
jgi:hypothetical protein